MCHCVSLQVNEIYHDQSLGAKINVVLVRIIMLGSGKVSSPPEKKTVAVTLPSCKRKKKRKKKRNRHVLSNKQTQRHITTVAAVHASARTNARSLLFQWTEQKRN